MLRIREAIVVEGRYDKNTLSQMVDTVIVETSGFGIFKDKERLALLRRLAEKHRIPWQTKEYIAGGNAARTIQRTKSGVRVAALSAAVRYLHAPASVGSISDFEAMLKLTRLFLADQAARLTL